MTISTDFKPHVANTLPNGAVILQRCYRPIWGNWVMLCEWKQNTTEPYVVWTVDEKGNAYHGRYEADYQKAEGNYLELIRRTGGSK